MARKRSGGRGGRAKAYRAPGFQVTCKGCNKVEKMPVRPPPGVELFCPDCLAKKAESEKTGTS